MAFTQKLFKDVVREGIINVWMDRGYLTFE
jgi:hypothetical protein